MQNILRSVTTLLIIAIVSSFVFFIAPVEDAEAYPMHLCNCRWDSSNGSTLQWTCDAEYHFHIGRNGQDFFC